MANLTEEQRQALIFQNPHEADRRAYLAALYGVDLDLEASDLKQQAAEAVIFSTIFHALVSHTETAAQANPDLEWRVGGSIQNLEISLPPELEAAEFQILERLWELCHTPGSDFELFSDRVRAITSDSVIFSTLLNLKLIRNNGETPKDIGQHVFTVTENAFMGDYEEVAGVSVDEQRGAQLFMSLTHDLFNVTLAANDWLHLHGRIAAAFIKKFLEWKNIDQRIVKRITKTIKLHHILQVIETDNLKDEDRVLTAQQVANFFLQHREGLGDLEALIRFALNDVSQPQFKSEHVVAILGMMQALLAANSNNNNQDNRIYNLSKEVIALASEVVETLEPQKGTNITPDKKDQVLDLKERIKKGIEALEKELAKIIPPAMLGLAANTN